jgi:hypothetical protein
VSRSISVHRQEDFGPFDGAGGWCVLNGTVPLYEEPFGSESAVWGWWSAPAAKLGLPLLASIYEYGFNNGIRWSGEELPRVSKELSALEEHWRSLVLPQDDMERRTERGAYLRKALAIAQTEGAVIVIT